MKPLSFLLSQSVSAYCHTMLIIILAIAAG